MQIHYKKLRFSILNVVFVLILTGTAFVLSPLQAQDHDHPHNTPAVEHDHTADHDHADCEHDHNDADVAGSVRDRAHKHGGHYHFDEFMPEGHTHGEGVVGTLVAVFKHTLMVTIFVLVMMLLIEYITVRTKGGWNRFFAQRNWIQIIFAALLGALPGCMGTYVSVSLYVHRMFSFAALVTAMIATSGDEAFIMLGLMPGTALIIFGLLLVIAIGSGFIVHGFMGNRSLMPTTDKHFEFHLDDPHCSCFERDQLVPQLRKITFERALLIFGSVAFIFLILSGELGLVKWSAAKITFMTVSIISLAMFITVPDHFLHKHFWGHVIKKHFLKVFLWTFAAFLLIHLIIPYLDLETWLETNRLYILLIAVLIGILPESGPHIVFIILFLDGNIPLSVLLANSIVQDGHGALPLLAESRRSFIAMKAINLLVGLAIGLAGYFMGW